MTESGATEQPKGTLVAIILPTLFHGSVEPQTPLDEKLSETAREWQKMSVWADIAEAHGALNGIDKGRLTELLGRIASAGEQLGLADTVSRDARAWLADPDQEPKHGVAARALAEITGYYAISAAHGLVNVSIRALLLNAKNAGPLNASYPGAKGFAPFSKKPDAWQPFNASVVSALEVAASATGEATVVSLIGILRALVDDARWKALAGRRNIDFHRWRPQSIEGGVTQASPWETLPDGTQRLTVYAGSTYTVPDPAPLLQEAIEGLSALGDAMEAWLERLPEALGDLGVPVFTTS